VITTHVLDTSRGRPAAGVPVALERRAGDGPEGRGGEGRERDAGDDWTAVGADTTGDDGRATGLAPAGTPLAAGAYRLRFDTAAYFTAAGADAFFPEVTVTFTVTRPDEHHHVPLLLNPFGYTTYRGS